MPSPAHLFRLLNEMVFVLLGGLLLVLALSGRYALPSGRFAWVLLGVFLCYWGLRAWVRPGSYGRGWPTHLRAASLVLVGAFMLAIAWLAPHGVAALLAAAGGVLLVRGLAGAVLALRGA